MRERQKLTSDEQGMLDRLLTVNTDIATGYTLAQSFGAIVREQRGDDFDEWLTQAEASGLIDFRRFSTSLRR